MNSAVQRRKIKGAKLMGTWDEYIFTSEDNVAFLADMNSLEEDDANEAIHVAIMLATGDNQATEEEQQNALAAASVALICAGAPFTAGDVVSNYPYIRVLVGYSAETFN